VESTSLQRACREFAAKDPVANVLVLSDLYSPLCQVSNVYCSVQDRRVLGICSVYHAFSAPSIVFSNAALEMKHALFKQALYEVSDRFISPCHLDEIRLFKEYATILRNRLEHQMIANPPRKTEFSGFEVVRICKNELGLLDKFYGEHHAEAWAPIQFKAGPYYCVKQDGKIVCAAGVHAVTPQIAQLGNIYTHEAHRSRGYATACTGVLAADLASKRRIISPFVKNDNTRAIRMYEKLGFSKRHEIAFLTLQKSNRLD